MTQQLTGAAVAATTPAMTVPAVAATQPPKTPGKFGRIFGGILGGAINTIAPGIGSLVGGFVGGNAAMGQMDAMLQVQQHQAMQMLALQNRVQHQTQEFTTVSNLLKARHDGEMSAVHNFKS